MGSWLSFVNGGWAGPVCLAVTVVGLVLSAVAWRRKGARSGIRGVAWSLLPAAAWLTHALGLVGRIVAAVVQFGAAFVLSPRAWLGVVLVGLSVVLFLVSGGIPFVRSGKRREQVRQQKADQKAARKSAVAGGPAGTQATGQLPATRKQAASPADDDDLSEVNDILKRHGIS